MVKKMKTRKVILENCNVLPIHLQMVNYLIEIQIQNFHRSTPLKIYIKSLTILG